MADAIRQALDFERETEGHLPHCSLKIPPTRTSTRKQRHLEIWEQMEGRVDASGLRHRIGREPSLGSRVS